MLVEGYIGPSKPSDHCLLGSYLSESKTSTVEFRFAWWSSFRWWHKQVTFSHVFFFFFLKQQLIHLQKQEVHKVWKKRNEDQRGVFVKYPKSKQPETFSVLHGGRMSWDKAPGPHECSIYIPSHLKNWATGQRWTLTARRELTFNHELCQMGVCLGPFCLSTLHNLQSDKQECFADMRQRHGNYVGARLCDGISRTVLISNILSCCLSKWYLNTFFFMQTASSDHLSHTCKTLYEALDPEGMRKRENGGD